MKVKLLVAAPLVCAVLCALALSGCNRSTAPVKPGVAYGAYDTELDWNDNTKLIKLGYQEAHGKRIFYQYCVWCHAGASPVGPSNRSNMAPMPPLMNDGEKLNGESDEYMQNIITLGGSALGKSSMMPPYGKTLSAAEITDVIAFTRAIAQPIYRKPGRPGLQTSITEQILTVGSPVEGVRFPVSVSGSVQRQSGVAPTGTIAFFVGTAQLASPVPVVAEPGLNGAAPFFWINSTPVTIPNAGSYALTAQYSGDSNYAASTTSTTINVLHRATASISVSPTAVNYGGTVTITGIIDTAIPSSNTALKPTGTVTLSGTADGQIKSGATTITTADESGNWAIQLSATVKPTNGENFVITYNSDSNYGTASASSNLVAVNLPDFSLTANPGLLTITAGQNGSSTITIAPLTSMSSTVVLTCSDPLLMNVACTISPASIRLANNASGTATVTLTSLGPSSSGTSSALRKRRRGMIWISKPAAWRLGGSCVCAVLLMLLWLMSAHKRSYRVALGLAVSCVVALAFGCGGGGDENNPVLTTAAITASATKIPAANTPSLALTATVTSSKAVTGTVNFWENGKDGALAPPTTLVNGTATAQVALPSPGTHEIYAQYSGDANNRASQSSTIDVAATGSAHAQIQGTTGPVTHYSSVYVTIQ
ncbi:MAG: Ig-like domain repeat protein [Bryobacteraceae bacterium]|jgi:mono/diheme cytochrome c family protein